MVNGWLLDSISIIKTVELMVLININIENIRLLIIIVVLFFWLVLAANRYQIDRIISIMATSIQILS